MIPDHDFALAYASTLDDSRVLPRIVVGIQFYDGQVRPATLTPILDSGAEASVIDGNHAIRAGMTVEGIVEQGVKHRRPEMPTSIRHSSGCRA